MSLRIPKIQQVLEAIGESKVELSQEQCDHWRAWRGIEKSYYPNYRKIGSLLTRREERERERDFKTEERVNSKC